MLPASFFDLVGQKSWLPAGPPAESLHEEDGPTQCTLAMGQAPIALQFQAPPPLRAETGSSPRQSEASPSECPGDLADHVASVPLPLHGASAQDDLEQPQETGGHEALVGAAAPLLPALSDGGDGSTSRADDMLSGAAPAPGINLPSPAVWCPSYRHGAEVCS
jgi:hypothetical protein